MELKPQMSYTWQICSSYSIPCMGNPGIAKDMARSHVYYSSRSLLELEVHLHLYFI